MEDPGLILMLQAKLKCPTPPCTSIFAFRPPQYVATMATNGSCDLVLRCRTSYPLSRHGKFYAQVILWVWLFVTSNFSFRHFSQPPRKRPTGSMWTMCLTMALCQHMTLSVSSWASSLHETMSTTAQVTMIGTCANYMPRIRTRVTNTGNWHSNVFMQVAVFAHFRPFLSQLVEAQQVPLKKEQLISITRQMWLWEPCRARQFTGHGS